MATKQETFDAVVTHLRKQGRKALSAHGKCAYRGSDGTKCAAGCLIPDGEYEPTIEGASVTGLCDLFVRLGHDVTLLYRLQMAHDTYLTTEWEKEFADIAKSNGLTYAPPEPAQ